jgi:hypothetical protein
MSVLLATQANGQLRAQSDDRGIVTTKRQPSQSPEHSERKNLSFYFAFEDGRIAAISRGIARKAIKNTYQ